MQEANPPCRSADNKADRDTAGKLPSEWGPVSLTASVYRLHRPLIYPLIAESCPELRISQITVQGMSPGAGECQWQSQGQRRAVVVPRLAHVEPVFCGGPPQCPFGPQRVASRMVGGGPVRDSSVHWITHAASGMLGTARTEPSSMAWEGGPHMVAPSRTLCRLQLHPCCSGKRAGSALAMSRRPTCAH